MITKEFTYKKAFENQKQAVKEREHSRQIILTALYGDNPRLGEIDTQLKMLGASLIPATLSGDKKRVAEIKKTSKELETEKKKILKTAKVPGKSFMCPLCEDTGYINGKICDCIKRCATRIMVEELSKEMPLDSCKFENFDLRFYSDKTEADGTNPRRRMTAILKLCREYVINFGADSQSLLFSGNTGLGKTHLTLAIVSGIIEKGFMPVYGSAENLFSIVEKEKFSGEGRGNYDTMLSCDLLVIDDLGTEMVTAFTKSVLHNLINTRILKGKPTIINTNLTMKEIEEKYSDRIASRLMGHYNANKFIGADIRQQKLLNK